MGCFSTLTVLNVCCLWIEVALANSQPVRNIAKSKKGVIFAGIIYVVVFVAIYCESKVLFFSVAWSLLYGIALIFLCNKGCSMLFQRLRVPVLQESEVISHTSYRYLPRGQNEILKIKACVWQISIGGIVYLVAAAVVIVSSFFPQFGLLTFICVNLSMLSILFSHFSILIYLKTMSCAVKTQTKTRRKKKKKLFPGGQSTSRRRIAFLQNTKIMPAPMSKLHKANAVVVRSKATVIKAPIPSPSKKPWENSLVLASSIKTSLFYEEKENMQDHK